MTATVHVGIQGKLLIVDDSMANIETLQEALLTRFDVIVANDGETALTLAEREQPDVILLDLVLPGISGHETCRQLKANPATSAIAVIFLTASSEVANVIQGFRLGAADYLCKPYYLSELLTRIETQISLKRQRDARAASQQLQQDWQQRGDSAAELLQINAQIRQKILVVDDAIANIEILNEILADHYEVLFATDGQQALQLAAQAHPDLILLDILLPDVDGYHICAQLKQQADTCDIPVIFVTALTTAEEETRGLDAGAIDYITKPFHAGIVRARVRNQLELLQHRQTLKALSLTDGLTGLANRRHFDEVLAREWQRLDRQHEWLSLLLLDVDHFKRYNDYYGHLKGDDALREVARVLHDCRRRGGDFVARYGGEEFALVLPNTPPDGALHMAETILTRLRAKQLAHKLNAEYQIVTVSIGIASLQPQADHVVTDLIHLADANLYKAKATGRNRAVANEP